MFPSDTDPDNGIIRTGTTSGILPSGTAGIGAVVAPVPGVVAANTTALVTVRTGSAGASVWYMQTVDTVDGGIRAVMVQRDGGTSAQAITFEFNYAIIPLVQ